MFFDRRLLVKSSGPYALIWRMAMKMKWKVEKRKIMSINIRKICADLLSSLPSTNRSSNKFSLYLIAHLLYGTVLVYQKQGDFLLIDVRDFVKFLQRPCLNIGLQYDEFQSVDGKAPPHTLLRKRKAANNDLEISLNFDAIDPLQFVLPPFSKQYEVGDFPVFASIDMNEEHDINLSISSQNFDHDFGCLTPEQSAYFEQLLGMENEKYESSNAAPTNFENDLLGHNSIRPSEIPSEHKELSILNDANIQGACAIELEQIEEQPKAKKRRLRFHQLEFNCPLQLTSEQMKAQLDDYTDTLRKRKQKKTVLKDDFFGVNPLFDSRLFTMKANPWFPQLVHKPVQNFHQLTYVEFLKLDPLERPILRRFRFLSTFNRSDLSDEHSGKIHRDIDSTKSNTDMDRFATASTLQEDVETFAYQFTNPNPKVSMAVLRNLSEKSGKKSQWFSEDLLKFITDKISDDDSHFVLFSDLVQNFSLVNVVRSFAFLLDLLKANHLLVRQLEAFGDIQISLRFSTVIGEGNDFS